MSDDSQLRRLIDDRDWAGLLDALAASREFGDAALRRVASNLGALRRNRATLYAQTIAWLADRGLPGPMARSRGDAGEWIDAIDPAASVVVLGHGDGRRLGTLARIGFGPIMLVEPSVDAWLGAIAWSDLSGLASDAGNELFVGPSWRDAARRAPQDERQAILFGGADDAALLEAFESLRSKPATLAMAA